MIRVGGFFNYLFVILLFIFATACDEDTMVTTLKVNPSAVTIPKDGGNVDLAIVTNSKSWSIDSPVADWLLLSKHSGAGSSDKVTLKVSTRTLEPRSEKLVVTAVDATPVTVTVNQGSSEFLFELTTDNHEMNFDKSGGTENIVIHTDASGWQITTSDQWLEIDNVEGPTGNSTIKLAVGANPTEGERTGTILIQAPSAPEIQLVVRQKGALYPNYNTSPADPDLAGMSENASQLSAKIGLGWNLGNSLEAIGSETAWGNPPVTKALIDLVKSNGFNAVRIPASWNQYMADSETAELNLDWLNRVKEVVGYCVDNDMYVILNIHWDGGWLENNCTEDKQEENIAKQKAFWEQIATHLRDFDQHLLFASANEPNVANKSEMAVLMSYHQTFVDAVRSTGGKNSYRVLVVQGPDTDIEKTHNLMGSLPVDEADDRLMVEVHYYTPWNFCGLTQDETWGKMFYFWGDGFHSDTHMERNADWGEENALEQYFQIMKQQFSDQGIPIVLGEFGAVRRSDLTGEELDLHLASRAYFFKQIVQKAKENGLIPFYWDNGATGVNGSALFDRNNNSVFDQQALDAMLDGLN